MKDVRVPYFSGVFEPFFTRIAYFYVSSSVTISLAKCLFCKLGELVIFATWPTLLQKIPFPKESLSRCKNPS